MRADGDCSDSFQTKTESSNKKRARDGVGDEVLRTFQAGTIRLDGRKAENESVAMALGEAKSLWSKIGDKQVLRAHLLRLLLLLDNG